MKDYSLHSSYKIFDHTAVPSELAFTVTEDSDGYGCVLEASDVAIHMQPELALLVAEALIKMTEHLKKK